ncbi:MAG: hypothetical protein RCG15_02880 [Candidatus Rickettsia vulgarisii]
MVGDIDNKGTVDNIGTVTFLGSVSGDDLDGKIGATHTVKIVNFVGAGAVNINAQTFAVGSKDVVVTAAGTVKGEIDFNAAGEFNDSINGNITFNDSGRLISNNKH